MASVFEGASQGIFEQNRVRGLKKPLWVETLYGTPWSLESGEQEWGDRKWASTCEHFPHCKDIDSFLGQKGLQLGPFPEGSP